MSSGREEYYLKRILDYLEDGEEEEEEELVS